jgi:hypothetical protein
MYNLILRDIEGVFSSATWTSHNIPTYPVDYQGCKGGDNGEYAMVSILPSSSGNYEYGVKKATTGLVAVKLFVKSGEGQGRLMAIADFLDIVLDNKTLPNGTKLGTSYLNVEGVDPQNTALSSASYIIPFTKYGE